MEPRDLTVYPLLGYDILEIPDQPTILVIAFQTEAGPQLFAMTREILEQLSDAFRRRASEMPRKQD